MESKLSLFLMSYKGYSVLKSIIDNDFKKLVNLVIVGSDVNVKNDYKTEIINLCLANDIKVITRKEFAVTDISDSTYALAISWRWLINLKKTKLFVIHDSLLPKYRGFAPLVNQLIHKENRIGVTLLVAADKYDTGDIIKQSFIQIEYPIKIEEAIKSVAKCYLDVSLYLCKMIVAKKEINPYKQDEEQATYSLWRDNQDYRIDWSKDAGYIERLINAVGFPYKGAKTLLNNEEIIIEDAVEVDDVKVVNRDFGKVIYMIDKKPIIVCGKGLIKICKARTNDGTSVIPLTRFRSRFHN